MEITIEQKEKENEYRKYIDNHINNVKKAWETMKSNSECMELISKYLNSSIKASISLIDELIKKHDLSKYEKEEFDAYRRNFYPVNDDEKNNNKESFDKAWEHHYTNNLHHWDYWYKSGNMDKMGFAFCTEEVCDWIGMAYQFNQSANEWYHQNSNDIHLGEKQRTFTEELLNRFYK